MIDYEKMVFISDVKGICEKEEIIITAENTDWDWARGFNAALFTVRCELDKLEARSSAQPKLCEYYALCRHGIDESKLRAHLNIARKCREEVRIMDNYMSAELVLDLLDAIRYQLWLCDIPSPTVPEYIEHHEDITKLIKFVDDLKLAIISKAQ